MARRAREVQKARQSGFANRVSCSSSGGLLDLPAHFVVLSFPSSIGSTMGILSVFRFLLNNKLLSRFIQIKLNSKC